ncbi:hypothetical protein F5146DRAFT_1136908 [Armillaria mellea]|nr:hypothetical protein F5146DRAFT_1136908 [Armillaria mellea]
MGIRRSPHVSHAPFITIVDPISFQRDLDPVHTFQSSSFTLSPGPPTTSYPSSAFTHEDPGNVFVAITRLYLMPPSRKPVDDDEGAGAPQGKVEGPTLETWLYYHVLTAHTEHPSVLHNAVVSPSISRRRTPSPQLSHFKTITRTSDSPTIVLPRSTTKDIPFIAISRWSIDHLAQPTRLLSQLRTAHLLFINPTGTSFIVPQRSLRLVFDSSNVQLFDTKPARAKGPTNIPPDKTPYTIGSSFHHLHRKWIISPQVVVRFCSILELKLSPSCGHSSVLMSPSYSL